MLLWLPFGNQLKPVHKLSPADYSAEHVQVLKEIRYVNQRLEFPHPSWDSQWLGAGEEKSVFCVHDHNMNIFAIELIDERSYLNGRFVGGHYFGYYRVSNLSGVKARPDVEFGLVFSGLIKVREYVHGFEWARFQVDASRHTLFDNLATAYIKTILGDKFQHYKVHYKDVHDRNVMFEIRPFMENGVPIMVRDHKKQWRFVKVGIQPIDVR